MSFTTMKKQLLNLHYGNKKGFVFTLDSIIAIIVAFILIGASANYVSKSENSESSIQISRTGSDIIAMLAKTNSFDSFNSASIQNEVNEALPENYNLRINLECSDEDLNPSENIILGDSIPENKFVGAGKRFFIVENPSINYCMVKYWVWQK